MKTNKVTTTIAIALSLLISYGFYSFWKGDTHSNLHYVITAIALLFSILTLVSSIGINFKTSRITVIIKIVSVIFFLIGFGLLVILANFSNSLPFIVISMSILTLVYILITYALSKSGQ